MNFLIQAMDMVLKVGAVSSLVMMMFIVLLQVFARLFLPQVPPWTEEASRLLFIYTVGFAAGLAIKEKAYVNVDTLLNLLPPKPRKLLELILDAILLAFSCLLIYEAYELVLAVNGQIAAALLWPMEIFYGGILLMVLFIAIYLALNIRANLVDLTAGKAGEAR